MLQLKLFKLIIYNESIPIKTSLSFFHPIFTLAKESWDILFTTINYHFWRGIKSANFHWLCLSILGVIIFYYDKLASMITISFLGFFLIFFFMSKQVFSTLYYIYNIYRVSSLRLVLLSYFDIEFSVDLMWYLGKHWNTKYY